MLSGRDPGPSRWWSRRPLAVAAIAMAMVAAACTGGQTEPAVEDAAPQDFQDRLLADGVTKAEYLQALEATRECMQEEGWSTSPPRPAPGGVWYLIDIDVESDDADPGPSWDRCTAQYLERVERAWARENLVPVEQRPAEAEKLRRCLEEVGVDDFPYDPNDPREEPVVRAIVTAGLDDFALSRAFDCLDRFVMLFPRAFPEP